MHKTLDIGCGPHRLPQAVGIDILPHTGVDFVHDMNQAPWPLPENQFTKFRCQHVIEHIREVHVLAKEVFRTAQNDSVIEFITPHYSSYASYGDPTHLHHFALASIPILFEQALGKDCFTVLKNEIKFTGSALDIFGWAIYKLSAKTYEKHFAWIFPANEIHTTIQIKKRPQMTGALLSADPHN